MCIGTPNTDLLFKECFKIWLLWLLLGRISPLFQNHQDLECHWDLHFMTKSCSFCQVSGSWTASGLLHQTMTQKPWLLLQRLVFFPKPSVAIQMLGELIPAVEQELSGQYTCPNATSTSRVRTKPRDAFCVSRHCERGVLRVQAGDWEVMRGQSLSTYTRIQRNSNQGVESLCRSDYMTSWDLDCRNTNYGCGAMHRLF